MKNFFLSLCIILVCYGAVNFIKNSGAAAKMSRFVFAVAVFCSVISTVPFLDIDSISFSIPANVQYSNSSLSESAFEQVLGEMLKKEGIEFKDITVYSSKNEDKSINIEEIRVKGVADKQRAEDFIRTNTGVEKIEVS